MPVGMGYNINTGEANYSSWGFVAALINWQRLLDRSGIYKRFENQGMQFELTKTDRIFNAATNDYFEQVRNISAILSDQFIRFTYFNKWKDDKLI